MKKFFKWVGIILGGLILIVSLTGVYLYGRYFGFTDYSSGGVLSENQAKYDVVSYELSLEINSAEKSIAGNAVISVKAKAESLNRIELDLLEDLIVTEVLVNGKPQKFTRNEDKLWVEQDKFISKEELCHIQVAYHGRPMEAKLPPWRGGFNWSKDANDDDWIGVSCEGEGAKIWFPCKDHPSDEPDSVKLHITVPDPYYCASNGILQKITSPKPGFKTYHWATYYPINNYNVNISIANYDIVERKYVTEKGSVMPVVFYVLPQNRKKADELIDMAVDMLTAYRKYFAEYPFADEKFGLAETDYLGMEHQTLNAYGNKFIYSTIAGNKFDQLMLHEMGHEWWGNKVTAKDWADSWIHEGICTYGESLYHLDKTGEKGYHEYMQSIKKRIRNKKPIIIKPNATTSESYHSDIYAKGAFLLHSLRYLLGDSVFFKTLKEFATDSSYTYKHLVRTEDFIELVRKNSSRDHTPFIRSFLYTTDLPEIHLRKTGDKTYEIFATNLEYELPIDIETDEGIINLILGRKPVQVTSKTEPVIDKMDWFLKKIVKENI
jgi:aminopeptidase N